MRNLRWTWRRSGEGAHEVRRVHGDLIGKGVAESVGEGKGAHLVVMFVVGVRDHDDDLIRRRVLVGLDLSGRGRVRTGAYEGHVSVQPQMAEGEGVLRQHLTRLFGDRLDLRSPCLIVRTSDPRKQRGERGLDGDHRGHRREWRRRRRRGRQRRRGARALEEAPATFALLLGTLRLALVLAHRRVAERCPSVAGHYGGRP